MEQDFEDRREETLHSVKRFESMLKRMESTFFDLDTYEQIVEHYMDEGKIIDAMQACELALEQYPYSLELMLCKAELLANQGNHVEALELIDKAELYNPSDTDIIYLRSTVYNLKGDYQTAIEILTEVLDIAEISARVNGL